MSSSPADTIKVTFGRSRLSQLLRDEQKRAAQLSMINEVSKIAVSILDPDELMRKVAYAIQRNFEYYDCLLYALDCEAGEMVLKAHAGAYSMLLSEGYRQQLGVGIVGWVGATGEALLVNDVSQEPRRIIAFPEEVATRSELCVPIKVAETVVGAIDVQSPSFDAFDARDLETLSTLADQIARVIHNAQLFQEMRFLKELNEQKAYELSLLRQIGEVMQGILDLDRLLHAILTCVTAGSALGFNRAILLLLDRAGYVLEGKMGVGPANREDAWRIWSQIDQQRLSLQDILNEYDTISDKTELPLYHLAKRLHIPLSAISEVAVMTVLEKRAFHITDAQNDPRAGHEFLSLLGANEFVSVPLIAKGRAIGVIVADNLYSERPILEENIELLTLFANQAGLAIENASVYENLEEKVAELEKAYIQLKQAQEELVRSERLSVIGEMAAHVAHEIRNPLTTIGGFARSTLKRPDDIVRTGKGLNIIVEEVNRLEKILTAILDYTKPSKVEEMKPNDLNTVVLNAVELVREMTAETHVTIHLDLAPDLPQIPLDAVQMCQVFLNIFHNALHAMPNGGDLRIKTLPEDHCVHIRINDTGTGIPPEHLGSIFNPFFTTKTYGTGLGLAISRKIVADHRGEITIQSCLNEGTTVVICLPLKNKNCGGNHENDSRCG